MAKKNGLAQEFYAHGYDLSGDIGAINESSAPREVLEVPVLNKSGMVRLLGRADGTMEFHTWFDDAAEKAHVALKALPTADVILLWAKGGTVSDVASALVAKQVDYPLERGEDGSLSASVRGMANGTPLEYLELLTAGLITHGSAASTASIDNAGSTANGMVAIVEIVDTDSGTPTIIIQDSPNDSTWSTLISFTAVASGNEPTAERKTVTGTVDRYLRITTTGTFSACDFIVAASRGTAQDDVSLQ